MTTLTSAQIDLIKKMNVQRIQTDDTEFFTPSESLILNELIALDLVQKVRGRLGWSAWQVVNFYDLMDSIDTPATFTATCECGELLINDADECADCVHAQTVSALPFDGPIEDTDYPAPFDPSSEYDLVMGSDKYPLGVYQLGEMETYARKIDPRDQRIAELEAQVKALQSQIGLLPANVYKAYLDTQDARLSQVPYAMACMGLKDAVSRAILDRPTDFPIVQEAK